MNKLLALALLVAAPAAAQHDHHDHPAETDAAEAPAGLSPDEAAGLRAGAGLGMARPAELRSYPGPLHVLELADALALTGAQRATAERLRAEMLAEAVPLGEQVVAAEQHLDALFATGDATSEAVDRITGHAAALRGRLRAVHLHAHLGMRDAMTADQIETYDRLRGHDGP